MKKRTAEEMRIYQQNRRARIKAGLGPSAPPVATSNSRALVIAEPPRSISTRVDASIQAPASTFAVGGDPASQRQFRSSVPNHVADPRRAYAAAQNQIAQLGAQVIWLTERERARTMREQAEARQKAEAARAWDWWREAEDRILELVAGTKVQGQ